MSADSLLIVRTARHRYAVRSADMAGMKMLLDPSVLDSSGFQDRPCVAAELGPLLDPADQSAMRRRHALLVPLRRRYVALLVDTVETFLEHGGGAQLPMLLREQLRQPWAVGVLLVDTIPIIQIDLRAVARSVLLVAQADSDHKGNTVYVSGT